LTGIKIGPKEPKNNCHKVPEELPEENGQGVVKNSAGLARIVLETPGKKGKFGSEMVRVLPLEPNTCTSST
jgi:hypothetical protein